jgi:hypothetical protein
MNVILGVGCRESYQSSELRQTNTGIRGLTGMESLENSRVAVKCL